MIISIFKRNMFFNSLLLLPYAMVIRLYSIVYPNEIQSVSEGTELYNFFMRLIPSDPLFYALCSIFIVFLEAVLINRLVIKNRFSRDITLLPGMFFILMVSLYPGMQGLSPILLGLFFIILSVINLFQSYKKYISEVYLFNTGMYLGVASMFYYNLILLGIPLLLGYLYVRAFKLKELFQFIAGILVVFYFYGFYIFWNSEQINFRINFHGFDFRGVGENITYLILLILYLSFSILIGFKYRSFTIKKSIQAQNKINILSWILLFSILFTLFIDLKQNFNSFYLLAFGLSYFISALFLRLKNNLVLEIVNVVIIFLIIIYQFQFYS